MTQQGFGLLCATLLMAFARVNGAPLQSAQEVLAKVAEKYRAPKRYLLNATSTLQTPEVLGVSKSIPITFAIEQPDKMRVEGELGALGLGSFSLWITDGETGWAYSAESNQFYKIPRSSRKGATGQYDGREPDIARPEQVVTYFDHFIFVRYRGDMRPTGVATLAGTQTISTNPGTEVECYVVHIDRGAFDEKRPGASRNTWWVDKDSFVVWKEENTTWLQNGSQESTSTTYNVVSMDEPLPKDLFIFVPPPGSKLGHLPAR